MPCSGFPYVVVFSCVHLFDVRGGFSVFLILVELLTITLWINTLLFILSGAVRRTWFHPPVFSWVDVTKFLALCECFVDRCLSFWPFYLAIVCSLSFDLRILITPLVSSSSSFKEIQHLKSTFANIWRGFVYILQDIITAI